jgi:UDP-GlcNAc:undecaprenyl-phosphate GlcNAc-1-phosphate transferase
MQISAEASTIFGCVTAGLLLALAATPIARRVGMLFGQIDRPDGVRKLDRGNIPVTGGFALALATAVPLAAICWFDFGIASDALLNERRRLLGLAISSVVVLALGAVDDRFDLRPRYKLLFQCIAAGCACASGFTIHALTNPFGGDPIALGWTGTPLTIFWFLCCMNAVNLVDGLDGLAAGVALFAALTMGVVSLLSDNLLGLVLSACLAGAVLGFLWFNFTPASIFLGDSGSLLLGFLIGAISLMGSLKAGTAVALVIPIITLGLPAFDTALAITRRWAKKVPIATGDRRHIHHVLLAAGLSQRAVVLIMYAVCTAFAAIALLLTAGNNEIALFFLATLIVLALVFVKVFGVVSISDIGTRIQRDLEHSRRENQAAVAVAKALAAIAEQPAPAPAWAAATEALAELGVTEAHCEIDGASPIRWQRSEDSAPTEAVEVWHLTLQLFRGDTACGQLRLSSCRPADLAPNVVAQIQRLRDGIGDRLTALAER